MSFDIRNTNVNVNVNVNTNRVGRRAGNELGRAIGDAVRSATGPSAGDRHADVWDQLATGYVSMYNHTVEAYASAVQSYWSFWGDALSGGR